MSISTSEATSNPLDPRDSRCPSARMRCGGRREIAGLSGRDRYGGRNRARGAWQSQFSGRTSSWGHYLSWQTHDLLLSSCDVYPAERRAQRTAVSHRPVQALATEIDDFPMANWQLEGSNRRLCRRLNRNALLYTSPEWLLLTNSV